MYSGDAINDATTPIFPLRIASQLSGTSIYALRQYVDLGLVIPYKTETNRRLYSRVDIQRIKCIRRFLDDYGLNIAGIKAMFAQVPCWLIRPCSPEDQAQCGAYTSTHVPCWEISEKGEECRNADCRTCAVYRLPERCVDIKSIFKMLENNTLNTTETSQ